MGCHMAAYIMTSPRDHAMLGQSKCSRIDGMDATTGGGGLTELEVLSMSGESMVTLNVSESMSGRDLWNLILDEVPTKPGLQLVVSHTSRLALNESLQQQGLGGEWAQVQATYMPVDLLAAWQFALGESVEDEEFSLNEITEVTDVSEEVPDLLHNLPKSLRTWTFSPDFNQGLHHVRLPPGLQRLTLGAGFNQNLDSVTWPAGLQSLTFGQNFNQNLDNVSWPAGLQSLTFGAFKRCFNWRGLPIVRADFFPSRERKRSHITNFPPPREKENHRLKHTGEWWGYVSSQEGTRWAPTSYKWSYNPYKWPYKWITWVITLLIGVITPFITGRGPPCIDCRISF